MNQIPPGTSFGLGVAPSAVFIVVLEYPVICPRIQIGHGTGMDWGSAIPAAILFARGAATEWAEARITGAASLTEPAELTALELATIATNNAVPSEMEKICLLSFMISQSGCSATESFVCACLP